MNTPEYHATNYDEHAAHDGSRRLVPRLAPFDGECEQEKKHAVVIQYNSPESVMGWTNLHMRNA